MAECVYYFSYATNLLHKRLKYSVPGAVLHGTGTLQDHEVDFSTFNEKWNGYMLQMTPRAGKVLWGAIWKIKPEEREAICIQEGVNKGVIAAKDVEVTAKDGSKIQCFLMYRDKSPAPPEEGAKWSKAYKRVVVDGAKECGFPQDYIAMLEAKPDNDKEANFDYTKEGNY